MLPSKSGGMAIPRNHDQDNENSPAPEDSSDSEEETGGDGPFHRKLSTKHSVKCAVSC